MRRAGEGRLVLSGIATIRRRRVLSAMEGGDYTGDSGGEMALASFSRLIKSSSRSNQPDIVLWFRPSTRAVYLTVHPEASIFTAASFCERESDPLDGFSFRIGECPNNQLA